MATLDNGLEAIVMRNQMESKDALAAKGSLYVGTGGTTTVTTSSQTTVSIPETTAFNPPSTNGGVMIRDTSANNATGWKVDKIKTENLENGRVEQADTVLSNGEYKSFVDAFVWTCLLKIYPVGSIYMSVNNVSPQTFLGGTWVAWGAGRVPVGVNSSDSDFNTVEKTGGEKAHKLSVQEMPSHYHSERLSIQDQQDQEEQKSVPYWGTGYTGLELVGTEYTLDVKTINSSTAVGSLMEGTYMDTGSSGGDASHNNLQPYITCHMWKRTA